MADLMMARLCLLAALAAGSACAQEAGLPDPTRPPAVLSAPPAASGQTAPVSAGPQLQSILISLRPGGRRLAVIDGKMLRQGQRIDGAVIEAIRPGEVVLRRGKQKQVLKLFRPAARVAAA
ncbi:MAG: MSHA biogenesis protein MshK [Pseudomonadota bacterium]